LASPAAAAMDGKYQSFSSSSSGRRLEILWCGLRIEGYTLRDREREERMGSGSVFGGAGTRRIRPRSAGDGGGRRGDWKRRRKRMRCGGVRDDKDDRLRTMGRCSKMLKGVSIKMSPRHLNPDGGSICFRSLNK
jgi:hypothetical protein